MSAKHIKHSGHSSSNNTTESDDSKNEEHSHKKSVHGPSHSFQKKLPIYTVVALVLIALIVIVLSYSDSSTPTQSPSSNGGKYGVATMEFYVMSQCPYGTQVEDGIYPVLTRLGDSVNFSLNFIGTYSGDKFSSLHGQPEVDGNRVQLCAIKYNPTTYMDMIACMNKNAKSIPGNWETCATENKLNVEKIKTCYNGEEGKTLLKASFDLSQTKGASGSPTMFLNGAPYNGGRDATSFLKAICAKLEGHPECASLPACSADADCVQPGKEGSCVNPGLKDAKCEFKDAPKVLMTIINDKRCGPSCDTAGIETQLQGLFPGIVVTKLDYATTEGKAAYVAAKPGAVPALLFDDSVKAAQGYTAVQKYLVTTDDNKYLLRIGASFDPSKEICDNNVDDTGNGKVDCADADCSSVWKCVQKTSKPTVELFVMSHCPFGTQIEKGILPVLDTLGSSVDFQLKFVNYAMHGKKEIDEQARQYCIQKDFKAKLVPYLYCFLNSTDGSEAASTACITSVGIDAAKITSCVASADTEFKLTASFNDKSTYKGSFAPFAIHDADNLKYGIQGSPSIIINGATPDAAGRDSASLLNAICYAFDSKPAACGTDMSKYGSPAAGFGFKQDATGGATAAAGCGV